MSTVSEYVSHKFIVTGHFQSESNSLLLPFPPQYQIIVIWSLSF